MTNLTTSEARAEALTIVLQILIYRYMPKNERAAVYAKARKEAADTGSLSIVDETAWLFADLQEAVADMHNRDGC